MTDLRLDLRAEPFPIGEGMLELMASGYLLSSVLFAAVELSIFDQLAAQPSDVETLARRIACSQDGVRRLLTVLVSFGLVCRDDDGSHRNAALASAVLVRGAPGSIADLVLHHQRHAFDLFARLTDGVRTGDPQLHAWRFLGGEAPQADCYTELANHPAEYALLLRAMNRSSVGVGRLIARQVDLTSARTFVDLGGGGGEIAIELAGVLPHLAITIVDLPEACRFAQARVDDARLGARIRCIAADVRADLRDRLAPADAVLLSGVVSDWPKDDRAAILARAAALLSPGGRLIVSETLFNATRSGPAMAALLSLFMLLSTRGDNFTARDMTDMLAAAGLTDVRVFRNGSLGMRDLIVARR